MKTKLFSINTNDFLHGLITAIGASVVTGLTVLLNTGEFPPCEHDLKVIGIAAISAGLAYIGKKFLSNSNNQFITPEPAPTPTKEL